MTIHAFEPIESISGYSPDNIPAELIGANKPLVFKGLVASWPIVQAAVASARQACDYLGQFYTGEPVNTAIGSPANRGAIFYNADMSGFDYQRSRTRLDVAFNEIERLQTAGSMQAYYVDSAPVDQYLPGFRAHNDLALAYLQPRVSLWMGNKTIVSAHHDVPDNIACVVAGKRRFILFPPEQLPNLYIGPLDFNPAGPAISMVDLHNPDFEKYPRYKTALAAGLVAELEPGDALYIPSMWWHQVEGLMPFNLMINYWWTSFPAWQGSPQDAFTHALMNIRSLPAHQRQHWKQLFDYYIFAESTAATAHIPEDKFGVLGALDESAARRIRAQLLNRLNR